MSNRNDSPGAEEGFGVGHVKPVVGPVEERDMAKICLVLSFNLIKTGFSMEDALKLITTNPATNLGLKNKGQIAVGYDADLCCFDTDYNLTDVFALGQQMMTESKLTIKEVFES